MSRLDVVFDDGGMNLLSSDALHELRVILSEAKDLRASHRGRSFAVSAAQDDTEGAAQDDKEGAAQDDTSLFVFRSGRGRIFAAGADMSEMQRFTPREAHDFAQLGQEVFAAIERLPFLTVALIDGDCFGGALDLVLAFDLRFATPRARFAHPGARLGIVTGFGGTSRWRNALARPAANQLFLANRVLSADEALAIGLVDGVAESHEEELARLESRDVRFVKELTNHSRGLSRTELLLVARRLGAIYSA